MKTPFLTITFVALVALTAVGHAASWQPSSIDYVKQSAASEITQEPTNFLLLNELEYDKHLAEQPSVDKQSDDKMQCVRRVQAYRCN